MLSKAKIKAQLEHISKKACVALVVRLAMRVLPMVMIPRKNLSYFFGLKEQEPFWFWKNDKNQYLLTIFKIYIEGIAFVIYEKEPFFTDIVTINDDTNAARAAAYVKETITAKEYEYFRRYEYAGDDFNDEWKYPSAEAAVSSVFAAFRAVANAFNTALDTEIIKTTLLNDWQALETLTAVELLEQPLWPNTAPKSWQQLHQDFIIHLKSLNAGFEVWLNWYIDRLEGKPIDRVKLEQWTNIPKEIESQGVAKTNAYLKSLSQYTTNQALKRVRTIFIGYGEAGKTSLIRALHGEEVVQGKEAMTAGIEIRDWQVPNTNIQAHFWDFGGQVMFHSTHKFFLRSSCVYVVVINSRADIDPSAQTEYWLEHVKVFGGPAPVLIVGNKADEKEIDIQMQTLRHKYPNIKGYYPLSCTHAKTSHKNQFEYFKQALVRELQAVGMHQMLFTPAQANVLNELLEYSPDHAFLSEQEFHNICDKHGISNEGELNREWLVDIFDKLGVMLHFDELKAFNDSYLLNPRWLTHGIYTLMNAEQARLSEQDIVNILNTAPVQDEYQRLLTYPADKCLFISKIMQYFRLCYPLPNDKNTLLIPNLLGEELPDYPTELKDELTLRFEFDFNGFLPRNLIGEFMVSRYQEIKNDLQSQRGAVFVSKTQNAEALVEADYRRSVLMMQVYGSDAKDYLMILYDAMKGIFGDLALDYKEWVYLPKAAALDLEAYEKALLKSGNKLEKAEYKQLIETAKDNQAKFISASGLKYDVKKVLGYFLSESEQSRQGITNHFYGARPIVSQIEEQHVSNQTVNVSHSTIHGSVLAAEKIENCLNTLQSSPADNDIKQLLSELLKHIVELNNKVPAEVLDQISREAEDLVNEINSGKPRKRNSLLSLDGIKDAAIVLGETAKPIIELAEKISPLLQNF